MEKPLPPVQTSPPPAVPTPSPASANANGIVGAIFSGIGLAGMLATLFIIFSARYEETTGDGQRDLVVHMGNGLTYIFRVMTGLFGIFVFGGLSGTGAVVSGLGMAHERPGTARTGFAMGIGGILICLGLVTWRMLYWGLLN